MKPPKSPKDYSLEDAVWKFATPTMRQQYERASSQVVARAKIPEQADREIQTKEAFSALRSLVEQLSNRAGKWTRMEEHLFALLQAAKLLATGVRTKPTLGSGREVVPAYLFEKPKANLNAGTIENFGHKFEAVKVRSG